MLQLLCLHVVELKAAAGCGFSGQEPMSAPAHPLQNSRVTAAFGVLSLFGIGLSLMAPSLFYLGAFVSFSAAFATVWLYLQSLRNSLSALREGKLRQAINVYR